MKQLKDMKKIIIKAKSFINKKVLKELEFLKTSKKKGKLTKMGQKRLDKIEDFVFMQEIGADLRNFKPFDELESQKIIENYYKVGKIIKIKPVKTATVVEIILSQQDLAKMNSIGE